MSVKTAPQAFVIEGGNALHGHIRASGNKNGALPILAACLLADEPVTLSNVPRIRDVETMIALIADLGAEIEWTGVNEVRVHSADLASHEAEVATPETEMAPIRAEILADEPAPEPTHVSEEPELVEEFAEPGAEDGAGASVEIAEPWPGYRGLSAEDVIARIDDATPAELAGIELYETANRHRQTVLEAAARSLRSKTGLGSPDRRE